MTAISFLRTLLQDPGPNDLHRVDRSVFRIRLDKSHALNDPHATLDPAKNRVFAVQPWCGSQGDEKLAAVRVRAAVSHTQHPSTRMFQPWMNLILELFAIYRGSSSAGACGIASLDHEVGDDAVEDDIVIVTSLGKSRKVLTRLMMRKS